MKIMSRLLLGKTRCSLPTDTLAVSLRYAPSFVHCLGGSSHQLSKRISLM